MPMSQPDDEPSTEPSWFNDRLRILLLAVAVQGGFIVLAVLIGWFTDTPPVHRFHWSALGVLEGVAATLPLVGVFFIIIRWPVGPLARIKEFSERILRPMLRTCTVVDFLGIAALAGL